jgi:hypothetical protein
MKFVAKYDLEFFKNFVEEKGGKLLSTEYRIVTDILSIDCDKGHRCEIRASNLLRGSWCWDCFCFSQRIPFDEDFFSRDNEASFYVAGFMAADGWKCRASDGYVNGIGLSTKDEDHLLLIKNLIKYEGNLKYSNETLPSGYVSEKCSLKFSSPKTFQDLEIFNVTEAKTYTYCMPEWLTYHPLVHHFMRGYIDGDGCFCYKYNEGQRLPQILFTMKGTAVFLQQFHDIIIKNKITKNDRTILPKDGKKYAAFNTLQYGGNIVISKMYDFIYKDATIFLGRKEEIAKMAKEYRMNGTGKKRDVESKKGITKELLIEKFKEFRSHDKVAEFFNCTNANISHMSKSLNIRDEITDIVNNHPTRDELLKAKEKFGTYKEVCKQLGLSKFIVSKIVKTIS